MAWTTRPRRLPPRCRIIHWTGAERHPWQVVATLARRGLSVHDIVATFGLRVTAEDYAYVCQHAGPDANEDGLGVEVVCAGYAGSRAHPDRIPYPDTIHGVRRRHVMFFELQVQALVEMAREDKELHGIPHAFPTEADGVTLVRGRLRACRAALGQPCRLPAGVPCRRHFRGIMGHFHVTGLNKLGKPKKRDPGTLPLLELARRLEVELR